MYLDPTSFNVRVHHESLPVITISASIGNPFNASEIIDIVIEKHKTVPLEYYTCTRVANICTWQFAYAKTEYRNEVSQAVRAYKLATTGSDENTIDPIVRALMEELSEPCACPFLKDKPKEF